MVLPGEPMMIEAVQTTASPAEIGAVVVVAVVCLAFWLSMLAIASRDPGGARRRRMSDMPGPVLGGTHVSDCRRSVAPNRRSAAVFARDEAEALAARADAPARMTTTPVTPARMTTAAVGDDGAPAARHAQVPPQRSSEADQPKPASAGSGSG